MFGQVFGESPEQKLKLQIFFIAAGMLLVLSSTLFGNWFYLNRIPFSVEALNSSNLLEVNHFRRHCKTILSGKGEFVCFCDQEECEVLTLVHLAGRLYILAVLAAIPMYICVVANIYRKIENLSQPPELDRDCTDREIFHFLAPALVTIGFFLWVLIVSLADQDSTYSGSQITFGQAFTNAVLGLGVLLWNSAHYVLTVRRAYQAELPS